MGKKINVYGRKKKDIQKPKFRNEQRKNIHLGISGN